MEGLVIDPTFWKGRKVFLTGHTGFKGSWMSLFLSLLEAEVYGFALAPEQDDGLFVAANLADVTHHETGNICDLAAITKSLQRAQPQVVIHMAAQSLVRLSYDEPVSTYTTNVIGTVNLLEAVRRTPGVEAVIIVTSDKCYENNAWVWGYRELDRLGGYDPYSNSKACAELVTDGYRRSFFSGKSDTRIATVRAGNVIGGGDWARDRLVPDAIRAFRSGRPLSIRNPKAIRPWQHVLDPVIGYLHLAERLSTYNDDNLADAWNFGPDVSDDVSVENIANKLVNLWGGKASWITDPAEHPHEARSLKLDCSKAIANLGWRPVIDLNEALKLVVDWYKAQENRQDIREVTTLQIQRSIQLAQALN